MSPWIPYHPFLTRAAALDPGLGVGGISLSAVRTPSGRGDVYRSRLNVRGLGGMWYSASLVVPGTVPGLRALRVSSALRAGGM